MEVKVTNISRGFVPSLPGGGFEPRHQFHRVLSLPLGQESHVKSRYNNKMRNMANERRTSRSRDYHDNHNPDCSYKLSCDSG